MMTSLRITHRSVRALPLLTLLLFGATPAAGNTLVSHDEALASAFPRGTTLERQTIFLEPEQIERATELSEKSISQELVIRYVGLRDGKVEGYAYFDAHRVRTLPETVMIIVDPEGVIEQIQVVAFSEPKEYFPSERWLAQFENAELDDDLSLKRSIRPITGATLTGRAITDASRRILAIHSVIEE